MKDTLSKRAPSTTRTPLRRRGYQSGLTTPPAGRPSANRGGRQEPLGLVATDAAHDLDPARHPGMLGKLHHGSACAVHLVRDGEDDRLDEEWIAGQDHWVSLSSAAQLMSVDNTGHHIEVDRPDVVNLQIAALLARGTDSP